MFASWATLLRYTHQIYMVWVTLTVIYIAYIAFVLVPIRCNKESCSMVCLSMTILPINLTLTELVYHKIIKTYEQIVFDL